MVGQQACNYRATAEAINIAKEAGYRLSFTGHSLGGWLAELSAFYCHAYFGYPDIKAVTFDSPGSVPMMEKLQSNILNNQIKLKGINIVTYLAPPNFVNCCNSHGGEVFLVKPEMKWPEQIGKSGLSDFISNQFGSGTKGFLSFEGHCLAGILATFDPKTGKPKKCQRMADWPRMEYTGDAKEFSKVGNETVKEKLDPVVGIVTPMMVNIVKEGVGGYVAGGTMFGALVDRSGVIEHTVKRTIEYTVDYAIKHLVCDTTLMTIIGFLRKRMNVNQEQYWAYYQLTLEKEGKENLELRRELSFDDRFVLAAKAKYREGDDAYDMNLLTGSVDKYLYKLYEAKEKLTEAQDLSETIKRQLEDLLSSFTIKPVSDGKYRLVPNKGYDVEGIRQRANRLMSVLPKNALKALRLNVDVVSGDRWILSDNLPLSKANYTEIRVNKEDLDNKFGKEQVVVISGAGGMGKSTLAAEYGRNRKQGGWQVRWIKGMQIKDEFWQIAKDLKITTDKLCPEEIRNEVYKCFARFGKEQQVLLIFDNVENGEKMREYLKNLPNNAKVIITAKDGNLLEDMQAIKLHGFGKAEAISYLRVALGISERKAERLVETVSESPFRLSKVVGYLKSHSLKSVDDFIKAYESIKNGYDHDAEIYPEIELLFGNLKEDSAESWQLLKYMAYLDAEGVALQLITNIMGQTTDELQGSINKLEQLSLMNIVTEGNQIILKVSHRIVQAETKKALAEEDKDKTQAPKLLAKLISELNKIWPDIDQDPENWKGIAELVGHAKILIKETDLSFVGRENLLRKIGSYYLHIVYDLKEALCYWEEELDCLKLVHKGNHPNIAISLNRVGRAYCALSGFGEKENIVKGLTYLEESLEMNKALFPGNNPSVATSLNEVGNAYCKLGGKENIEKGLEYLHKSLVMLQELFPGNQADVANSLKSVGSAYYVVGGKENTQTGLDYLNKSLVMYRELFPGNQASVATALNEVGNAYCKLEGKENIVKGLMYLEESLGMNKALFPGNNPSVATSLNEVGNAYCKLEGKENIEKGLTYLEESLKMNKALFPGNHLSVAFSLSGVGLNYCGLGGEEFIRKGLTYLEESLKMNKALFPGNHPNVVIATLNDGIGLTYCKLGGKENIENGLTYLEESLKINKALFPGNNPSVATLLNEVGDVYKTFGAELVGGACL